MKISVLKQPPTLPTPPFLWEKSEKSASENYSN